MRGDAVLIHVGRGPVVDEQALYAALEGRTIRGATLDVWYVYPKLDGKRVAPSRLPFHTLPNVVMTPHNSGRSEEAWDRRFREVADNLDALARGEKLRNVVKAAQPG
jgi:phosphoglycerate dehydrogenase-like enzyme